MALSTLLVPSLKTLRNSSKLANAQSIKGFLQAVIDALIAADVEAATSAAADAQAAADAAQATADAATTKTDRITLRGAASGDKIELREGSDGGSNKVTLQAPATLAADRVITVPDADVNLGSIATAAANALSALSRLSSVAADTAAIQAIAAVDRADGMIVLRASDGTLWRFSSGSSAAASDTVIVPTAGTGRWLGTLTTAVWSSLNRTGTGSEETIAHTLGVTPRAVWWSFRNADAGLAMGPPPQLRAVPGTHTSSAVLLNVTLGNVYDVFALP